MGFTCGIIGLPNVGKSTIFNALTSAKAAAANFPFCTIEPNTGAVPVPDPRLQVMSDIAKSEKIIPTQVTFVDIAGLIRGAAQGEGLGNQFLGHIRAVDAVAHIVRCFEDTEIIHVEGSVDPIRDVQTIETELMLSDLDSVEKQLHKLEKTARSGDKVAKAQLEVLAELSKHIGAGNPANSFQTRAEPDIVQPLLSPLLTAKPTLFVANVDEAHANAVPNPAGSTPLDKLAALAKERGAELVVMCGKLESEIAELAPEERAPYLEAAGLSTSGLDRLALAGYRLLKLLTFFTVGPKETHAWTAVEGTLAPQSAGKIHTDFERGFIRAEVVAYDDFAKFKGYAGSRDHGVLRTEGKEYVVKDGDIVHFFFNV